jgi:hypothetical protein
VNALVLIALKRPYTFVVLAILILIFGGRAAMQHAIAVLVNAMPSGFSIAPANAFTLTPPAGSRGPSLAAPAATPRHRERRTADGSGECRDRRVTRGFLSQYHFGSKGRGRSGTLRAAPQFGATHSNCAQAGSLRMALL